MYKLQKRHIFGYAIYTHFQTKYPKLSWSILPKMGDTPIALNIKKHLGKRVRLQKAISRSLKAVKKSPVEPAKRTFNQQE